MYCRIKETDKQLEKKRKACEKPEVTDADTTGHMQK